MVTQGHRNRLGTTMGLSRTVSEINCDFSRKSQVSPNPRVFCPPPSAEGVSLEIEYRRSGSKTRMMGYRVGKSLTISSAVWIQYTNATDRQTDGRTGGHLATTKSALTHSVAR